MRIFGQREHNSENPWEDAPAWAIELGVIGVIQILNQEKIMTQADDLNNAVTSLATGYSALHDSVQVETDALVKAMGNIPQPDPATSTAITQAIANITAITGKMATDAAALTAA